MTNPINWHKSSFSGADNNQNCVELAGVNGEIKMRESDDPAQVVTTSREKLRAFILGVKAGEFDDLV
ncbi:DUF397 domain-containing protein [Streptomyces sp. H27-D2]|uniref:DUF397 domain-containing protein n=1 Tax=Streptomyces sp. H27-D2 TaxID=3046304 RepID=UPI002DBFAB91|nr:DUF397 domain-containing protein [Streptomyces sp. H27-D2]MEC4018236.1 DUF397 domain-containing protein [Streptomyces sp. H27-D2]